MLTKSPYAILVVFLVSTSLYAKPYLEKKKKETANSKISYQEAKKQCLSQDSTMLKQELKDCIKQKRSKKSKVSKKRG